MGDVLVVEDDADIRDLVALTLRLRGHGVAVAANATTGWDLAVAGDYDLIIVDWTMTDPTGGKLCSQLRRHPTHADTPIILTTTYAGDDARERALGSGATEYFAKPFSPHALAITAEQLMAR